MLSKKGKVELLWGGRQFWGESGARFMRGYYLNGKGTVMRRYCLNEDLKIKELANCISGMFQKVGMYLESSENISEAKCG